MQFTILAAPPATYTPAPDFVAPPVIVRPVSVTVSASVALTLKTPDSPPPLIVMPGAPPPSTVTLVVIVSSEPLSVIVCPDSSGAKVMTSPECALVSAWRSVPVEPSSEAEVICQVVGSVGSEVDVSNVIVVKSDSPYSLKAEIAMV